MQEDTIIAISTPLGYGGLGVVRLSGAEALNIAKQIFRPKRKTQTFLPRQAHLGNIYDFYKNEMFEEAFLIFFPSPRTYTREDVIEISCHGKPRSFGKRSYASESRPELDIPIQESSLFAPI